MRSHLTVSGSFLISLFHHLSSFSNHRPGITISAFRGDYHTGSDDAGYSATVDQFPSATLSTNPPFSWSMHLIESRVLTSK